MPPTTLNSEEPLMPKADIAPIPIASMSMRLSAISSRSKFPSRSRGLRKVLARHQRISRTNDRRLHVASKRLDGFQRRGPREIIQPRICLDRASNLRRFGYSCSAPTPLTAPVTPSTASLTKSFTGSGIFACGAVPVMGFFSIQSVFPGPSPPRPSPPGEPEVTMSSTSPVCEPAKLAP